MYWNILQLLNGHQPHKNEKESQKENELLINDYQLIVNRNYLVRGLLS